jgi:rubrerythrin
MTRRQITAMRRHADRLDRAAERAKREYDAMRDTFPEYAGASGASSMIAVAARATDDAVAAARRYRDSLERWDRDNAANAAAVAAQLREDGAIT